VDEVTAKIAEAEARLASLDGVVVALSGGVDSSLLLALSARALPPDKLVAVTAMGSVESEEDIDSARALTSRLGVRHDCLVLDSLQIPGFADNTPLRCYLCRGQLYEAMEAIRTKHGFTAVLDGAIADDRQDYRPGLQAAKEAGVLHPLAEAGFTKEEVREASRRLGLPTAERPASPCLASRFPYGEQITLDGLKTVAKAEELLHNWGFPIVRVRHHDRGRLARIEVPAEQIARLCQEPLRTRVSAALKEIGYTYVAVDLVGFRSGSLNEVLDLAKEEAPASS
jgi:pyridinium-3,5-biscarboxylic acid mononucleotide sulfurtransferase